MCCFQSYAIFSSPWSSPQFCCCLYWEVLVTVSWFRTVIALVYSKSKMLFSLNSSVYYFNLLWQFRFGGQFWWHQKQRCVCCPNMTSKGQLNTTAVCSNKNYLTSDTPFFGLFYTVIDDLLSFICLLISSHWSFCCTLHLWVSLSSYWYFRLLNLNNWYIFNDSNSALSNSSCFLRIQRPMQFFNSFSFIFFIISFNRLMWCLIP